MNKGKTIFAQIMSLFNEYEFKKCVDRCKGDRHTIKFNCRDQFMVMSFAQFTDSAGLRDIETTLNLCGNLYRSGIKVMPRSTLAEANEKKDWRNYQDFVSANSSAIEDPLTTAELYRERWQIELFFKWIKQHLHIKTFYGTTKNAVYTQIWIAVCDYLLLIIAKKRYGLVPSLHSISNSIGQVLFQRADIRDLYNKPTASVIVPEAGSVEQLMLW